MTSSVLRLAGPKSQFGSQNNTGGYETRLRILNVPSDLDTRDILEMFGKEGTIRDIVLYTKEDGTRSGDGAVFFADVNPSFRKRNTYRASVSRLGNRSVQLNLQFEAVQPKQCPNPTNTRSYPTRLELLASDLSFGMLRSQASAQILATVAATDNVPIVLAQNGELREITIIFPLQVGDQSVHKFKIRLTYTSSLSVWELGDASNPNQRTLVLSVDKVPELSVKRDEYKSHEPGSTKWNQNNAWYRKTDITNDSGPPGPRPTTLRKRDSRLNVGSWRVYCLKFDLATAESVAKYSLFCEMLEDFNVKIQRHAHFDLLFGNVVSIWSIIDPNYPTNENSKPNSSLAELGDLSTIHLPFRTRYQLEACLSEGLLNEFNVPREFVQKLQEIGVERSLDILEGISAKNKRVFDPMKLLEEGTSYVSSSFRKLRNRDFTYMYSAVITPTTIHYNPPVVEISNRVLRKYSQYQDRFLRVKFEEERPRGKIYPRLMDIQGGSPMDEIFQRIKSTLENGIVIGDRHYHFLGFGSSQFREHGAYFFASLPHLGVTEIRESMGNFKAIRSVSKYAARLGQCFSTTRQVRGAKAPVSETPDVWTEDGKYIFTDGVGIISRFMAQLAASEMGLVLPNGEPPSVLQFRSGGAKGVLAVQSDHKSPKENRMPMIWIRPSQSKFHADYEYLEVVRWSQFSAANLNRQIIAVLSDLGVKDRVFISMMTHQLQSLNAAMDDQKIALRLLQKDVDANQVTLIMASMIQDGFLTTREPFLTSLLYLWRAWCIKHLKEKAKIPIKNGAVLLGCVDEFAVLEGHYHHRQATTSSPSLEERSRATPEVFVQLSEGSNQEPEVITGYMILLRSPSLHPGDIRVVRGVDRPELHHMRDVVVFPQTGDRDLGNMCSGGDLDGDDYLVIWDQDLLPTEWNHPPMDYLAPSELLLNRDVTVQDIIEFFITYMKNDSVGTIANAHLATADKMLKGVKSARCRQLAELHSCAVDFPKSGHAAKMPVDLQPSKWPHFMGKPKNKSYQSMKILGKLYDLVEQAEFAPRYDQAFDSRILGKCALTEEALEQAAIIKEQYDATLRRIMMQYDIQTEFEVWSAFFLYCMKRGSDYKMGEILGEHTHALKDTFRTMCIEAAGGRDFQHMGPFVSAMYEVTWREVQRYVNRTEDDTQNEVEEPPPLISFPWMFHKELGRIANCDPVELQALGGITSSSQPLSKIALTSETILSDPCGDHETLQSKEESTPAGANEGIDKENTEPSREAEEQTQATMARKDATRGGQSVSLLEQLASQ